MKAFNTFFILLLILPGIGFGQASVLEDAWTAGRDKVGLEIIEKKVEEILLTSSRYATRDDQSYLRALFQKTQKEILHHYIPYSGIEELAHGRYDCLTATILFSEVLNRAGFDHSLLETNYHIFLVVKTDNGNVLMETTDRWNGLITDSKKMNDRISAYRNAEPAKRADARTYASCLDLYKVVNAKQLPGLLYYNMAVKAYNQRDWIGCAQNLERSYKKYNSPRAIELAEVLSETISIIDIGEEETQMIEERLKDLKNFGPVATASFE